MKTPHFDIVEVQQLVASNRVRFSVSKAKDPLLAEYGLATWRRHGIRILSALSVDSFHDTVVQAGQRFDVYGVRHDGVGWYVKVTVENAFSVAGDVEEQLYTISCHPLEARLRTNTGEIEP